MLYRLLRPDENIENGLMATDPLSDTTVFQHVCKKTDSTLKSKFISTCGSLQAVLAFKGDIPNPIIVKIWEKNLPVVRIDLRTKENRNKYCTDANNFFHDEAMLFQLVLLVGYVPETHVELYTPSGLLE
jgi:hypothetical protein